MSEIGLVRDGHVAIITLDAPDRRNSLTAGMAQEFIAALDQIEADTSIGALVVRGSDGHFCAGGDRPTLERIGRDPADPDLYDDLSTIYRCFQRLGDLSVPCVAAVRGAAVGAGLNLMLAADIRIVAQDARLLSGFLRIGLHPGGGHFVLTARLAGVEAAAALALFGEEIDGTQASDFGLAWESLPDADVEERALKLATRAATDPELTRRATRTFRQEVGPPMTSWAVAVDAERSAQMWSMRRQAAGAVPRLDD